jgi:hypothetical protein
VIITKLREAETFRSDGPARPVTIQLPFLEPNGIDLGQSGLKSLGNSAKALVLLAVSLPSHGRDQRFNPSPAYHVILNDVRMLSSRPPS